jgi:hypothetical protein
MAGIDYDIRKALSQDLGMSPAEADDMARALMAGFEQLIARVDVEEAASRWPNLARHAQCHWTFVSHGDTPSRLRSVIERRSSLLPV